MRPLLAALLLVCLFSTAEARWKAQYVDASPEVQAWYERQQTTPETRVRIKAPWYMYCCANSDTVDAKFEKKDGVWRFKEIGSEVWKDIPQDIVQPDVMTPHGRAILFIDKTYIDAGPVCFFPGGAGT